MADLRCLLKTGRTRNPELMLPERNFWKMYQTISIAIQIGNLNTRKILRKKTVSSNFQQNMPTIGEETRNRPSYYSWNLDPNCLCTDSLQQKWSRRSLHAFPTFALIQKVLKKVVGTQNYYVFH